MSFVERCWTEWKIDQRKESISTHEIEMDKYSELLSAATEGGPHGRIGMTVRRLAPLALHMWGHEQVSGPPRSDAQLCARPGAVCCCLWQYAG